MGVEKDLGTARWKTKLRERISSLSDRKKDFMSIGCITPLHVFSAQVMVLPSARVSGKVINVGQKY